MYVYTTTAFLKATKTKDYYLNLLSWSQNNLSSVALSQSVYLWDAASGSIKELMSLQGAEDYVSSVAWIQQGGNQIASHITSRLVHAIQTSLTTMCVSKTTL